MTHFHSNHGNNTHNLSMQSQRSPAAEVIHFFYGDFRMEDAHPSRIGYYAVPDFFPKRTNGDEHNPQQMVFYQIVKATAELLFHTGPTAVFTETFSNTASAQWKENCLRVKDLTLKENGKTFFYQTPKYSQAIFLSNGLSHTRNELLYDWINLDHSQNSSYLTYLLLPELPMGEIEKSEIWNSARLSFHMDELHPVLILQAAADYPIQQVIDALSTVCCA